MEKFLCIQRGKANNSGFINPHSTSIKTKQHQLARGRQIFDSKKNNNRKKKKKMKNES